MRRSKLAIFLVLTLVTASVIVGLLARTDESQKYIFDSHHNITLNDVKESTQRSQATDYKLKKEDAASSVSGPVPIKIDHNTLKYFKSLEQLFQDTNDISEHFKGINQYLLSNYPESEANTLFEIYKNYLSCEMAITETIDIATLDSSTPSNVINNLSKIQNFRRSKLGNALADSLFGAKVKATEYAIRKAAVIEDATLYGAEKEEVLANLNADMWGDESVEVSQNASAYTLYQEKLKIYKKDIEDLDSAEESKAVLRGFRDEFFPPEIIERLEVVEQKRIEEDTRESNYYKKETAILNSSELDDEEKVDSLKELQDELFGNDADNFRSRLSLRVNRQHK